MSVSPVTGTPPPSFAAVASSQASSETPASAPAPLPNSAIPPVGMQGRPPIDNIATNPELSNMVSMASVVPQPGSPEEAAAASQAAAAKAKVVADEEALTSSSDVSDEVLLEGMRDDMHKKAKEASKKVARSAFKYMYHKTNWLNKETASEAEHFLTIKVPGVLADELSGILNDALGLSD